LCNIIMCVQIIEPNLKPNLNLEPNISIVYNATIKYVSLKEILTNMHIALCSARDFANLNIF